MDEMDITIKVEERLPKVPRSCLMRCPMVRELVSELERIDRLKSAVATLAMGEEIEEAAANVVERLSLLGIVVADQPDSIAEQFRQDAGEKHELLSDIQGLIEENVNEVTQGCSGPLEAYGTDSAGRVIGSLTCASCSAPDGMSYELSVVYRYPK